jgi:hypothetical protein
MREILEPFCSVHTWIHKLETWYTDVTNSRNILLTQLYVWLNCQVLSKFLHRVRFKIFRAVTILNMFFWVKTSCGLVGTNRRFREVCSRHVQFWKWREHASPKRRLLQTNPHGDLTQRTSSFDVTSVKKFRCGSILWVLMLHCRRPRDSSSWTEDRLCIRRFRGFEVHPVQHSIYVVTETSDLTQTVEQYSARLLKSDRERARDLRREPQLLPQ